MISARSQGKVETLLFCQTFDPARGSFMVHPLTVKHNGVTKTKWVPNEWGTFDKAVVQRAAHHVDPDRRTPEPHNEAFDYAVDYNRNGVKGRLARY